MNKREWITRAACGGMADATFASADPFYPKMARARPQKRAIAYAKAKAICNGCPVRQECLADAMAAEDITYRWGMWAGTEPGQRWELAGKGDRA